MKKFTFIAIIGCIMAAMSFTSCNSDSDNSYQGLTEAEIQQCFYTTRGAYSGKIVYRAENKANIKDKTDTLDISWNIMTDSTMTIHNFPVSTLAESITNNDDLKSAIAQLPPRTLDCAISYVYVTPIQFLIGPNNIDYELEYGGSTHKVQFRFFWNNYSFGQYVASADHPMEMQIWAAALYVDGNQTSYGITPTSPVQFFFYTEKK